MFDDEVEAFVEPSRVCIYVFLWCFASPLRCGMVSAIAASQYSQRHMPELRCVCGWCRYTCVCLSGNVRTFVCGVYVESHMQASTYVM